MITPGACPRCEGAVIDYGCDVADNPLCITCGWRRPDISPEIEAEVERYLGEIYIGNRYEHRYIGTGKPSPSGWEKRKRQREVEEERPARTLAGAY